MVENGDVYHADKVHGTRWSFQVGEVWKGVGAEIYPCTALKFDGMVTTLITCVEIFCFC